MVNRLKDWIKSRVPFKGHSSLLAEILSSESGRDIFLGEKKLVSLNPERIKADANAIVQYAKTEDYSIFAKEVWLDVVDSIEKLSRPSLSSSESDFIRGRLAQSLAILKLSYSAHRKLNETKKENEKRLLTI